MASELENGAFFYLRVLDDKPVALFRLDVNTKTKEVNETIWDGESWQETDRLTMYIAYGSTEVEQVLERDATLAFPDAFRDKAPNFKRIIPSVMSKHLAGKHDQSSHGRGGGISAPRDESRAKQKQAWELHQQGKTWEEVAKEAGYANGGAARLAGKAHEKRMKEKGDGGDTPKIDEKPAKPKTDAEGAQAIADAKAVVDKATGGRPVAEVLAEERAKAGSSKEPTAKELEVTEAVIKSGEILRGEVERRRDLAGKQAVEVAKSDLEILRKDQAEVGKYKDKLEIERNASRKEITEEVLKSPVFDKALDERLDYKTSYLRNEDVTKYVAENRVSVKKDMREFSEIYGAGEMTYTERTAWAEKRAKERFPRDKKAQAEYAEIVTTSVWASQSAERELATSDPKMRRLKAIDDRINKNQNDVITDYHSYNKEISDRETIVELGGVTSQQNAEIIRSVLTDSGRTMTDKPTQKIKGTKPVVAELRDELQNIPDELWKSQRYQNLNVTAGKGRGHWDQSKQQIKTDGEKGSGRRASTLLHESMHAVEDMNPQITQMQFVMLNRRAKGRAPEPLSKIGKRTGYRKDEIAVKDEWSNAYSGKIYRGGGRIQNYEIMTMGIESLYKRDRYPYREEIADDDHLNFVMGVLAHA
jgi:hypothetical protein